MEYSHYETSVGIVITRVCYITLWQLSYIKNRAYHVTMPSVEIILIKLYTGGVLFY
mgnify:CR=1 FL=1